MVRSDRKTVKVASPLVREAVEAILERLESKPRLIVLFGSESRGEATPESDIDLLLLLDQDDVEESEAEAQDAVYDVMWRHDFDRLITVHALPTSRFEEMRRKGYGFAKNVDREGRVLWSAA